MRGETPEFSDETLLGYLLGGLTDAENSAIESALADSESLRIRLSGVRELLAPLAEMDEPFEPRSELVSDTMALIVQSEDARSSNAMSDSRPPVQLELRPVEWSEVPIATRVAWLDSIVAIAAGIIFLSFLLPSVWQWRESARRIGCSENLRNVSAAFWFFADFSPSRRLPALEMSGTTAFAGMYAIRLQDCGLLDSVRWLQCPSNQTPLPISIPTSEQFLSASAEQQQIWRSLAGGNYAYHLGSVIDGKYCTPTLDDPRVRFAILGDTWPPSNIVRVDATKPAAGVHGDQAANILYSDRGIRLIRVPNCDDLVSIDHPFLNRDLQQAAGIGLEDTCLGPSHCLPAAFLLRSKQPE